MLNESHATAEMTPKSTKEILGSILDAKFTPENRAEAKSRIGFLRTQVLLAMYDSIPAEIKQRPDADSIIAEMEIAAWSESYKQIQERAEPGNIKDVLIKAINFEIDGRKIGIVTYINQKIKEKFEPALEAPAVPAPPEPQVVETERTGAIPVEPQVIQNIPVQSETAPTDLPETVAIEPPPQPDVPFATQYPAPEYGQIPQPPTFTPQAEYDVPQSSQDHYRDVGLQFTQPIFEPESESAPLADEPIIPDDQKPAAELAQREFINFEDLLGSLDILTDTRSDADHGSNDAPSINDIFDDLWNKKPRPTPPEEGAIDESQTIVTIEDIPDVEDDPPATPAAPVVDIIEEVRPETIEPIAKERTDWAREIIRNIGDTLSRNKTIIKRSAIIATVLLGLVAGMHQFIPKSEKSESRPERSAVSRQVSSSQIEHFINQEQEVPQVLRQQINKDLEYIAGQKKEFSVSKKTVIEDPDFVYPNSELSLRDILFTTDRLGKKLYTGVQPISVGGDKDARYRGTVDLLLSAKEQHPQAVKFRLKLENGRYHIETEDWKDTVNIKQREKTGFAIIGGELESVAAAVRAADRGQNVILIYSGPLGGLSSKEGGNMRFFDYVPSAPVSVTQQKIMQALGMVGDRAWSIPPDAGQRLRKFIETKYGDQIRLIHTDSYNSMHVGFGDDRHISNVTTGEGIQVEADHFIDAEPAAEMAEKVGLDTEIDTPNIGYGMVFDVDGVDQRALKEFHSKEKLNPDRIISMAGLSREKVLTIPELAKRYVYLQHAINTSTATPNESMSWGYQGLGHAFDLYMNCLEFTEKDPQRKAELHKINQMRRVDGFNVSMIGNEATFNSVSYQGFKKAIKQHDHSLKHDPEFKEIREIDIPALEHFFSILAGKELSVAMPNQLYVRQACADYKTKEQYKDSDFINNGGLGHAQWMQYHVDVRAAEPRDIYDKSLEDIYEFQQKLGGKEAKWRIRPETSQTKLDNFGIVGCAIAPPKYVGALRIEQHLIGTSEALVDLYLTENNSYKRNLIKVAADELLGQTDKKTASSEIAERKG